MILCSSAKFGTQNQPTRLWLYVLRKRASRAVCQEVVQEMKVARPFVTG
ncbi:hypothetical protein [Pasteuria penetrans]|nr:hypothetical protein [Pasteuria penetrans]